MAKKLYLGPNKIALQRLCSHKVLGSHYAFCLTSPLSLKSDFDRALERTDLQQFCSTEMHACARKSHVYRRLFQKESILNEV